MNFMLVDYNDFVVDTITKPNVVKNATESGCPPNCVRAMLSQHVILGAGDWLDMSNQLKSTSINDSTADPWRDRMNLPPEGRFDLILAAETTYSTKSCEETALLLCRHLVPTTGTGLVATKKFYFGVGGGSSAFLNAAERLSVAERTINGTIYRLSVSVVRVYNNGKGNIRELLKVSLERDEK